ncbi:hypothetical protein [Acinetobacter sp. ANC 4173]|jgi:hypothetical protein|uniref:hypothetical protein n=1 Tax=Acinetobacter sp. ANC 4173 TaxID=2529837 RepID=UPI00103FD6A0|nr:hypothetical protein [Acinetobacter sp. ANC 4173]TCB80409.1 hypothetical protein E0H94_07895 [Acinetobacter sp. ANC 4173]
MFVTESLNRIPEIVEQEAFSAKLKKKLAQKFVNLEATLLRAKVLRELSKEKANYIVQSAIQPEQASFAYLFAPFILGNLNQTTIYHTQATVPVLILLNRYYQVEKKLHLKVDDVLQALNIYLDLHDTDLDEVDFFYYALLNALCRADVAQIYLITHLKLDAQKIAAVEQFFKIKIHLISTDPSDKIMNCAELNMRQLLFKNKDQSYIELCEKLSKLNAQLLSVNGSYNQEQATQLVEDMFYAEHIYEKLSVYAEYMQTCLQNTVSSHPVTLLV